MKLMTNEDMEETCPIGIISMENWEWPQGVGLFSLYLYYQETGREDILDYLEQWFDNQLRKGVPPLNVNTICPLLTLTYLHELRPKGRYLEQLHQGAHYVMREMPRTEEGGLQHVVSGVLNEGQLWDDTLYMTVLFLTRYGTLTGDPAYTDESVRQFLVHLKYLTDPETGLFFHGWTFHGHHHFARALWGRGNAWYTAGLVDYLDMTDPPAGVKLFLSGSLERQAKALERLQASSGRWHTLLTDTSSYEETSATAAFAYGLLKAIRCGYLSGDYKSMALRAFEGVVDQIDGDGIVRGVSYGTGMGRTLQEYKDIPLCPMPYGQSMALLMLVEGLKQDFLSP
ncbi:glycoside hydrolase family 88 protein [Paenibacillus sp. sptzw28]|nr:glycoside hydrolase family 88 protein [Paenibacillus sp. sptzw28]